MAPLLENRLTLVSGKGGVGKSTLSAALALAFAQAGYKTLACEVNAEERISRLLGRPAAGSELASLEPNLWAVNLQPAEAMREYGLMMLKSKSVYRAVFENRLVNRFLRFIPSLQELVMLGKIYHHATEKQPDGRFRFDRVVVDAPATGHALSFFSVPQVLLDTVPPGPLRNEAQKMRDLLVDPGATSAVLVCLPEEMPVNETLELAEGFKNRLGVALRAVVLNACVPSRFSEPDLAALSDVPALLQVARAQAEGARSCARAKRLLEGLGAPVLTLPQLFTRNLGRAQIAAIVRQLREAAAVP